MKNILVIGKNSFLAKAFNFLNKENFYSHREFKKIKFENYDKLNESIIEGEEEKWNTIFNC